MICPRVVGENKQIINVWSHILKVSHESSHLLLKISGILHSPIGSLWYSYLPQGKTMVQSFLAFGLIWCDNIPYSNPRMCHTESLLVWATSPEFWELELILLFNSLKSEINLTDPSFLGMMKAGAAHSDWFTFSKTLSWHHLFISFFGPSSLLLGMGNALAW